jgi:hypothetical protein
MRFVLAVLLILPGLEASAQAQQGRGAPGGHSQAPRPVQQQQQPRTMQQQSGPVQQQRRQVQPASRQQTGRAIPPPPQPMQRAIPAQQRQVHPIGPTQQGTAWQDHARAQHSPPTGGRSGFYQGSRISNHHYAGRFGREHSFHVNRRDYDHRRFRYGGYAFSFVDPWPMGWGYSDDVYVEYTDDGYYMYNRFHPGVRISIDIL